MRYLRCCLMMIMCYMAMGNTKGQYKSDDLLIDKLLMNLRSKDVMAYSAQFLPYDTFAKITRRLVPANAGETARIANMQAHPEKLQQLDPEYNKGIGNDFTVLLQKGIDSGIHWTEIMLMRYELEKMMLSKDMIGFEKIAPTRLQGYVFVQDMLTTRVYTLAIKNVFSVNGKWYGGQLVNVLEAQNVDEYIDRLAAERKIEKQLLLADMYGTADTAVDSSATTTAVKKTMNEEEEDEEDEKKKTQVQDRKLYVGTFDDEIKIELYLRSLQGNCPAPICGYEAIYKFGDNEEYIKLNVTRKPDGKWVMEEDSEEGTMELVLSGDTFTGAWTSKDNTEYEVKLTEKKEVKAKKLYMLDDIVESYQ